ncbi:MAG: hypothetical protein ABSA06_07660 [Geobacteraceae bacterium]
MYKSTDGGSNWSPVNTGLTDSYICALGIDPVSTSTIYAADTFGGVYKSTNGGNSWSPVNTGLTNTFVQPLAIDPTSTSTIYTGTYGSGVYKSTKGGSSWSQVNTGLKLAYVYALAIDPSTSSTIYAGTWGGGVFKSTDGGSNWSPVNTGMMTVNVYSLAIDPSTPSAAVYAGTYGGGVFKSTDGGSSWSSTNTGLTNAFVQTLAIDPSTPATIYAGTYGDGVYKSMDGGNNWSPANTGMTTANVYSLTIDHSSQSAAVFAGTYGDGVFKSTDGGSNWSPVNTGLTNTFVQTLAIDPSSPATVYAGTYGDGVFKSTDGGSNWSPVNTGLTNTFIQTLAIDPSTPATVYAGTYGDGVYKSTDGGSNWSPVNTGMTTANVYALTIDPSTPSVTVIAGTYGSGVYKSTDGGSSWSPINIGLTNAFVQTLAIDPSTPAILYAGTDGGGVFSRSEAPDISLTTHFAVSTPASATAGTAFNFTVTALDQFNNTATSYSGTVHFTSSDGAAVLPANATLTNGTGTFSATMKTMGVWTITATDTVTATITRVSSSIDVSPAVATHFVISAPASATVGTAFNFTVTALDQFNNTATGYSGTVHFTSSDGATVLLANGSLTNGVGIFSVTLKKTGNQTITVTDTVAASITGISNVIYARGISINKGASFTITTAVTLNLAYTGAVSMQFSTNGTTWTPWAAFTQTKAFTLPSGNGKKTVYVRFKDGTAAVSTVYSANIILDAAPPANGTITATQVSGSMVNLTWQGFSDAISGIASYKLVSSTSRYPACSASPSYSGLATSYSDSGLVTGNTYYYRVCAVDNTGNISTGATATRKVLALAEYDPPMGSILINSGSAYTKSAKVTLTLNATDASGVSQMCISNTATCTAWIPYATSKAWTLTTGDGPKTVNILFKDKIGNATAPADAFHSNSITLDTKPPTNGTLQISDTFNLTWSGFADAPGGSGLKDYILVRGTSGYPACSATAINTSDPTATSFNDSGTATIIGKTYYYRVCARDNANNISTGATASKKVLSEYTPPTGTIVINNNDPNTKTAKVTLTINADDNGGSGLSQMCVSNTATCTAWITYATSKAWTLAAGDGPKTVNILFKDKNGNTTAPADAYHSNSIILDTKPPTNGTLQISNTFNLTWSGFADVANGSGLKDYILVRSTSSYPACSASPINTTDPTATAFDDSTTTVVGKTYYYRVCARDNAGNISTGATASKKKL